ncbi:unnamed protein product [marine sediment metagenome]|uniref:Uncharacterized protein n=1 Tax=marine sediment metagenome TaxID=412755 RepID=X1L9N2_9ZZZZ
MAFRFFDPITPPYPPCPAAFPVSVWIIAILDSLSPVFTFHSLAGPAAKPDYHRAPVTGGVRALIKLAAIMAENPSTLVYPDKARFLL